MKLKLGFTWIMLLLVMVAQAQFSIKGRVLDAKTNEPMPAVTVGEKGTSKGTITDVDGRYTLNVSSDKAVLVVSFVGYASQQVAVNGRHEVNFMLQPSDIKIEEVVVTGYGSTQSKAKLTSSIAKVDSKVLETGVRSNPAQALAGSVAGLKVVQASGKPGSTATVTLRGGTNWDGSGSPLVIVDGQVRGGFSDINPEDIESMDVLKDAGATALYGARANNGVILITTKRGKAGKSEITAKVRLGVNYLNEPYKFLNAGDYLYWMRMGYKNATDGGFQNLNSLKQAVAYGTGNLYFDPSNPNVILDGNKDNRAVWSPMILNDQNKFLLDKGYKQMTDPVYGDQIIYKEFNYKDVAFNNPAKTQDYNISVMGGNEKGSYYAGLGFYNEEGLPIETFYKRVNFTFNGDYKVRDWLTSYTGFSFADARWKDTPITGEGNYFARMLSAPPTMRGYNEQGEPLVGQNLSDGNPQANIDKFLRKNNSDKFTLSQSFKVNFMRDLSLKVGAIWMYDEGFYESFNRDYLQSSNNWNRTRSSSAQFERTMRQTYNAVLSYKKTLFENHNIDAMLGGEFYDTYNYGLYGAGKGAPTDDFRDLSLTLGDKDARSIDTWHDRQRILSAFSRINYDFKSKYLLSFTFREDGYSTLFENNRWGFFPGVSAGWVLNKEQFMQSTSSWLNLLKVRASYGVNGNVSGIGSYQLQGSYGAAKYDGTTGFLLGGLPNPELRWERSNTSEVGVDISLLNNRIFASIAYYDRTTRDKIATIPVPSSSGVTGILSNNGELRNKGLEIETKFVAVEKAGFKWDVNVNFAWNKNKVVKLPDNGLERNRQSAFQIYNSKGEKVWVGGYQEGQEPGGMWLFVAEGIYKSAEEIAAEAGNRIDITSGNNGSNGRPLYGPEAWAKLTAAEKSKGLQIQPGDVKWKDVNGDGIIDNYDRVYVGRTTPRFTGGITSSMTWKGLSLFARMDYALGFYQYDNVLPWFMGCMQGSFNPVTETKGTWTPTNVNAQYPIYTWADQLGKRNYARDSKMFAYKADYLCFREVSLSYTFPKDWAAKAKMQNLQVTLTGQNLGYLTKAKTYSPEIGGSVGGGYALPRTFVFGVNLTF